MLVIGDSTHGWAYRSWQDFQDLLYTKPIDWSEGWLIGLVVFHILLTIFNIITRNHHAIQAVMFFILLLSVRSSELINEYAAANWKQFSRQQYFDSQGLFISVVFSMPVLFNCMVMVINWLWISSNMMVTAKRAELELQQRPKGTNKTDLLRQDCQVEESKKEK